MCPDIVSIDFGGTSVNAVLSRVDGTELVLDYPTSEVTVSLAGVRRILDDLLVLSPGGIFVTGGSNSLIESTSQFPLQHVSEIEAIGRGGLVMSGLKQALVVSLGTGTAMVAATGDQTRHVGGSGLGGGTLLGLVRLLLQTASFAEVESLAREGTAGAVDLSVMDIVGGDIGIVSAKSTASHFGNVARQPDMQKFSRPDIARGLVTMVGQSIARLALVIARAERMEQVVVIGHVIESPLMQSVFSSVAALFGGMFVFPDHARQGVVRGALAIGREQVS